MNRTIYWCFAFFLFLLARLPDVHGGPIFRATRTADRVLISWSEEEDGRFLEITDRITPDPVWWPARTSGELVNGVRTVQVFPTANKRFYRTGAKNYVSWLQTVRGPIAIPSEGVILPHEHILTDLRGPTTRGYGQADPDDVVRVMKPLLVEARQQGVQVLIECTGIGVGRNVPVIKRLSTESGLPIVVPTGVYGRANFAPSAHRAMTEDQLTQLFVDEIRVGIEDTGVKAGFIKIATGASRLTALEEKFLRAAGRAARETGAVVASHTTSGTAAKTQTDILEAISPAIRFIWVHAQNETNRRWHKELAARGVYIEFDSLGWNAANDTRLISVIKDLLQAGFGDRVLLSHDAGWYQPGEVNGGTQKPYTYLLETFVQKLKRDGIDDDVIQQLTLDNPCRAFAFLTPPAETPPEVRPDN